MGIASGGSVDLVDKLIKFIELIAFNSVWAVRPVD
jgi:hypothetical protein